MQCVYRPSITRSATAPQESCEHRFQTPPSLPRQSPRSVPAATSYDSSPNTTDTIFSEAILTDDELTQFAESKARRLLEIRLMTHAVQYILTTADITDYWLTLWRDMIPKLSIQYDAVLYCTCALSATHLLLDSINPIDSAILQDARRNYLLLGLRETRKLCNSIDETNAEAVCLCASVLNGNALAMMSDLSQEPAETVIDWLKQGKVLEQMFWDISSATAPVVPMAFTIFHNSHLLVRKQWADPRDLDEPFLSAYSAICEWEHNLDDRETYRRTLVYVNWIQRWYEANEPAVVVERKLQVFGVQIPKDFVTFCGKRKPSALIVLAYFFGVMSQVEGRYYWLQQLRNGDRASHRQIRSLRDCLPEQYHATIRWPLSKIEIAI